MDSRSDRVNIELGPVRARLDQVFWVGYEGITHETKAHLSPTEEFVYLL